MIYPREGIVFGFSEYISEYISELAICCCCCRRSPPQLNSAAFMNLKKRTFFHFALYSISKTSSKDGSCCPQPRCCSKKIDLARGVLGPIQTRHL